MTTNQSIYRRTLPAAMPSYPPKRKTVSDEFRQFEQIFKRIEALTAAVTTATIRVIVKRWRGTKLSITSARTKRVTVRVTDMILVSNTAPRLLFAPKLYFCPRTEQN